MSKILILSFWSNDEERLVRERARHLLSKAHYTHHAVTYLWAVGDSSDETETILREMSAEGAVIVVNVDTGIDGSDLATHRRRFAASANAAFAALPPALDGCDDFVCLHESDLLSPSDVLDRLYDLSTSHGGPSSGWPTIDLCAPTGPQFYDIYAYRHLSGTCFTPQEPRPDAPFRVSSFGSVWMAPVRLVGGRSMSDDCIVDLCRQWCEEGVKLWCDPHLSIEQPTNLWSCQ